MPIKKVPVVHKFGIISQSQRTELQKRLINKLYQENVKASKPSTQQGADQLDDDFVEKFNSATTLSEIEKLESKARKIYERIKRKVGLKSQSEGGHVDVCAAWIELAQLAQCRGRIQEDCLDTLTLSLRQAPLDRSLISVLFFLAETVLYWLQMDAFTQRVLRSVEVKLLKLGELIFVRLFFHHMASHLREHDQHKQRLQSYLVGFVEAEKLYKDYADALYCSCYINAVGRMVVGDSLLTDDMLEAALEGDELFAAAQAQAERILEGQGQQSEGQQDPVAALQSEQQLTGSDNPDKDEGIEKEVRVMPDSHDLQQQQQQQQESPASTSRHRQQPADVGRGSKSATTSSDAKRGVGGDGEDRQKSAQSTALSSSVHDLSPTLWHALDVWRCNNRGHGQGQGQANINMSLLAMAECSLRLATENWIDVVCAVHILFDVAHVSLPALQVVQDVICGRLSLRHRTSVHVTNSDCACPVVAADTPTFGDTGERGSLAGGRGKMGDRKSSVQSLSDTSTTSGHVSRAESVYSTSSQAPVGMQCWPWQAAVVCTQLLADVCLNGATSDIQKVALLGTNRQVSDVRACAKTEAMRSAGLLDLLLFDKADDKQDADKRWSWMVRYVAAQGLMRVCRTSVKDDLKAGMRNVVWDFLLKLRSFEKDERVHEALKVGQADVRLEMLLDTPLPGGGGGGGGGGMVDAKMAAALSALYLPPPPPPVPLTSRTAAAPASSRSKGPPKLPQTSSRQQQQQQQPLRTSLREEIMLATAFYEPPPSFNERTSFDLRRIVEDQWRKEMQSEMEEGAEERMEMIGEKRQMEEEMERRQHLANQRRLDAKQASKLSRGTAAASVPNRHLQSPTAVSNKKK